MLELRLAGETQRKIAACVFGDERLQGRVERILAAEKAKARAPRNREAPTGGSPPSTQALFDRYRLQLEQRFEAGERVAASEIATVVRIETMLQNRRTFSRLRELTRAQPDDASSPSDSSSET